MAGLKNTQQNKKFNNGIYDIDNELFVEAISIKENETQSLLTNENSDKSFFINKKNKTTTGTRKTTPNKSTQSIQKFSVAYNFNDSNKSE